MKVPATAAVVGLAMWAGQAAAVEVDALWRSAIAAVEQRVAAWRLETPAPAAPAPSPRGGGEPWKA